MIQLVFDSIYAVFCWNFFKGPAKCVPISPLNIFSTIEVNLFLFFAIPGTDVHSLDNSGRTPLHLARARLRIIHDDRNYTSDQLKLEVSQVLWSSIYNNFWEIFGDLHSTFKGLFTPIVCCALTVHLGSIFSNSTIVTKRW